jgi:DNA repair protein SbcD/Mre11
MADPIRVLHFADVHIGMENYGRTDANTGLSSRVVDFLHRMDDMVAYAREHDVDLVIFAGDAFKTRSPNPTYQREFAWRLQDLAECAPVVLLVGNHDLAPNALRASSVEIYDTLRVANVWVAQDYEVRTVRTQRGDVVVGAAPYPIRSRMMQNEALQGSTTIREIDAQLEAYLTGLLEGLATEADETAAQISPETPRLLTGHFTVRGAVWGSERSVMLGRDVQVSQNLLADPRWDYVALGHIHKHQNLTQDRENVPPVVYSGSLERIDFGEQSDVKGFCWVELARNATRWHFEQVQARPMVTIKVDCREERYPLQTVTQAVKRHKLSGAIVRLHITLDLDADARLSDAGIRDVLRQADVFYIAAIRREVERPERTRLGESPEGLTNQELLERYLRSRDDINADYREALLGAATDLMNDDTG